MHTYVCMYIYVDVSMYVCVIEQLKAGCGVSARRVTSKMHSQLFYRLNRNYICSWRETERGR